MRITYACPACHATVSLDGIESLAPREESHPWPFSTRSTAGNAEGFPGRRSPHPAAEDVCHSSLACPACGATIAVPAGALAAGSPPRLTRCLVCPSTELFVRKDFPQRVGLAIVVAGLAASCVAWAWRELVLTFAILFGTALVDVVLYLVMPDCLSCYRCGARYRGAGAKGTFGGFDLETHEKHRQQAARLRAGSAHGP